MNAWKPKTTYINNIDYNNGKQRIHPVHVFGETIENSSTWVRIEKDHFCPTDTSKDHVVQIGCYPQTHIIKWKWSSQIAHNTKQNDARINDDEFMAFLRNTFSRFRCIRSCWWHDSWIYRWCFIIFICWIGIDYIAFPVNPVTKRIIQFLEQKWEKIYLFHLWPYSPFRQKIAQTAHGSFSTHKRKKNNN